MYGPLNAARVHWARKKRGARRARVALHRRATGVAMTEFAWRQPDDISQYLFAKAGAVAPSTIAQARCALVRLLRHLHCHDVPWDDEFGRLGELDLFLFAITCCPSTPTPRARANSPLYSSPRCRISPAARSGAGEVAPSFGRTATSYGQTHCLFLSQTFSPLPERI